MIDRPSRVERRSANIPRRQVATRPAREVHPIPYWQRALGNQAMQQMLRSPTIPEATSSPAPQPERAGDGPLQTPDVGQPQPLDNERDDEPSPFGITVVISGPFEGGYTMEDYYPNRTPYWLHGGQAGTWETPKMAGANVQIYASIQLAADPTKFEIRQFVTPTRLKLNGVTGAEEGQKLDDIKKSGHDATAPPFRREWVTNGEREISMADAPGVGSRFEGHTNEPDAEIDRKFETSVVGPKGKSTAFWWTSVRIKNGRATRNKVGVGDQDPAEDEK